MSDIVDKLKQAERMLYEHSIAGASDGRCIPLPGYLAADVGAAVRELDRLLTANDLLSHDLNAAQEQVEGLESEWTGAQAEIARLKHTVISFLATFAGMWAAEHGMPDGEICPDHYDTLAACGARMDDFTRSDIFGRAKDHG
jgi:hypothetical protein